MNEIIIFLFAVAIFFIIEIIVRRTVLQVNKDFQWLIVEKDKTPLLDKQGLSKFISHGFDSELVKNQNYDKIIDLFNKGLLIKNLIKPQYSS